MQCGSFSTGLIDRKSSIVNYRLWTWTIDLLDHGVGNRRVGSRGVMGFKKNSGGKNLRYYKLKPKP